MVKLLQKIKSFWRRVFYKKKPSILNDILRCSLNHESLKEEHKEFLKKSYPTIIDDVKKASFAFHNNPKYLHPFFEPGAHNFSGTYDPEGDFASGKRFTQKCLWCGRSRYDVRYDEFLPQCHKRPSIESVENILYEEELKYAALRQRAEHFIPEYIHKNGVSGKSLATLHQTHGYDIDIASDILNQEFSQELKDDYEQRMQEHSIISKNNKFKKL